MFTAREPRDSIKAAKEDMINEGGNAIHDVKDSARRLKGDANDAATAFRDDLEDVARKTGRHVRELAESASHNAGDIAESLTMKIRENPIQSSLIALGVGVIFGMLHRR